MPSALGYIKENFKFIYSLVLIIFIPIIIVISTLIDIRTIQNRMDNELKDKAILAESVFASMAEGSTTDLTALQSKIDQVTAAEAEIKEITVLTPQNDGFTVIATSDPQSLNLTFKSALYTKVWVSDEASTTLVKAQNPNAERNWVIISPLKDRNLQKEGLVVFKTSLGSTDELTRKNINQTLIVLVVTIFLVLLLLINHFRFYEYAVSFKSLKEIDKMKDDFISIASHEMKTPMAAIKGYLSMIDEGVAGKVDKVAKLHLEKINANVGRLDALANELLDVSRLEQERVQFDMEPVDITEVVKHIFAELKVKADEKGLYLRAQDLASPHVQIFADAERLAQVLDNIIGNAIKYTEAGGVEVAYQIDNGKLFTMVRDTGIGISPADQKRLFEKFYRVQNRQTMDIPGTGLGLWIAREIIKRMNGNIDFSSKEGDGSVFTVSMPIIKEK